jgi:hypothetical protein
MKKLIAVAALGLLGILPVCVIPAMALDGSVSYGEVPFVEITPDIQVPAPQERVAQASVSSQLIQLEALKNLPDQPLQLTDSELARITGTGFEFCCSGGVCPVCFTRFTPPVIKSW